MTVTVVIKEANGSSQILTATSQGRYCTTDSSAPGLDFAGEIPSTGFHYSYWKHHCLTISGTYTSISNFRWYTSGSVASNWSLGTGGCLLVALRDDPTTDKGHGCPHGNYDQARGIEGVTGSYIKDGVNGHDYYKDQLSIGNADNYTEDSPLVFDDNVYGPNATVDTYYVVTQTRFANNAIHGVSPGEQFAFRFDEI